MHHINPHNFLFKNLPIQALPLLHSPPALLPSFNSVFPSLHSPLPFTSPSGSLSLFYSLYISLSLSLPISLSFPRCLCPSLSDCLLIPPSSFSPYATPALLPLHLFLSIPLPVSPLISPPPSMTPVFPYFLNHSLLVYPSPSLLPPSSMS